MGNRQQELQASVELIWALACDQAPEGTDLRPDIEYGKDLLFAAPELLESLELAVQYWRWMVEDNPNQAGETEREELRRCETVLAKAKGE